MKTTELNDTPNATSHPDTPPSTPHTPHPPAPEMPPHTQPSAEGPDSQDLRRRTGYVARLPKNVRDQINQMLDDGVPYAAIIEKLGDAAHQLSTGCIGTWKAGGHQDWLKEQRLLADCRFRHELSHSLAGQGQGIDSFQAAHKVAADLICEVVAETGPDALRQALKLNPFNLLRALNSLSRLSAVGLKCERHLADEADRNAQLEREYAIPKKGGVTPRTLRQIENEFHLFSRYSGPRRPQKKRKRTAQRQPLQSRPNST